MRAIRLAGTTDGSGDLTVTGNAVNGLLYAIDINLSACDATADLTCSSQLSDAGLTFLTLTDSQANTIYYPRGSSCGSTGTSNTDYLIMYPIAGAPRIVVAQGGATKAVVVTYYVIEA